MRCSMAHPTVSMKRSATVGLVVVLWIIGTCNTEGSSGSGCHMLSDCSGHGLCNAATKKCTCFEGWGASTDVTGYRLPDCSSPICPSGPSWADVPSTATTAHALEECSGMGLCDRTSGQCTCFPGYTGSACQRTTCPSDCSGHGRCLSMRQMATDPTAVPVSAASTYKGAEATTTWDQDRVFGCVCDSSWPVGLESGKTQTAEWFGADCSLRHCPSGDDPVTMADETNCNGVNAPEGGGIGAPGNLCHVDCANRGICAYSTGLCQCFSGYSGENCATQMAGL